jgi:tetratricopeptide (TPR) repeat protein
VAGCDIKSLPLSPAEAFLLSRVDAIADDQELAVCTGLPLEQVTAMLERLEALGAITRGNVTETRRRLLGATDLLPRPDAPAAGAAQDDAAALRRQVLARRLSGTLGRVTPPVPVRTPVDRESIMRSYEAASAQAEQAAEASRRAQLDRSLEQGKAAHLRQDHAAALDAYRLAASLAPDDPEVQATCEAGIRAAAAALADVHWKEGVAAEGEGRWEDALLAYGKVCTGRPGDPVAHQRVAIAALRVENVRRAVEYARKAVELAPGSAKLRVTLARAYAAAGFEQSADGQLDRALELAAGDAEVKNLVLRLRTHYKAAGKAG